MLISFSSRIITKILLEDRFPWDQILQARRSEYLIICLPGYIPEKRVFRRRILTSVLQCKFRLFRLLNLSFRLPQNFSFNSNVIIVEARGLTLRK